jgi:hypothetical protein
MTAATTLYEAVEPQILWQQLYTDARREVLEHSSNPKVRLSNPDSGLALMFFRR